MIRAARSRSSSESSRTSPSPAAARSTRHTCRHPPARGASSGARGRTARADSEALGRVVIGRSEVRHGNEIAARNLAVEEGRSTSRASAGHAPNWQTLTMASDLERLRERTNGYTVTPRQYARAAYVALGALTLIVLSGAAVRLTGSGLGCPDWPKCYGNAYPPLNSHAVIEFSNRLITVPVSIAAAAAWVLALRRRPYRRDLAVLGFLLPLGVVGQAVLGGFTVRGALDYGYVMGHFALSMLIILAAVALAWRASHERAVEPATADGHASRPATSARSVVLGVRALAVLGALTIFAGTAATA